MKRLATTIIGYTLCLLTVASTVFAAKGQLGVGYGRELRENTDLSHVELFYRMPLSYEKDLGEDWKLRAALEFAGGIIDDADSKTSATGRLSLMPQMILSSGDTVHFLLGFGPGFMMGETEFESHNLGGPFFLSSKVGFLLILGKNFGLECSYYHQSNAGIYTHNTGLNMLDVAISYRF